MTPTMDPSAYARPEDEEFRRRELDSFLPDKVFDAHCHLVPAGDTVPNLGTMPPGVGRTQYLALMKLLFPSHVRGGLFISWIAERALMGVSNAWTSSQVLGNGTFRGLFFVAPDDDPEWVRQEVRRLGLAGLKCYHTLSGPPPTFESELPAFLPEALVKVAHEEGWFITLHMVKARAVADPSNLRWIRSYCERYPNMKLILAHSAEAFSRHIISRGSRSSRGCGTSTSTAAQLRASRPPDGPPDVRAAEAPLRLRLPCQPPPWAERSGGGFLPLALRGLAHLGREAPEAQSGFGRSGAPAVSQVGLLAEKLTDKDVEDIFWNNAARLFNFA